MSCKQKKEITLVLFVVTFVNFYMHRVCHSVSLGQREEGLSALREPAASGGERVEQITWSPNVSQSARSAPGSAAEPRLYSGALGPDGADSNLDSLAWTVGSVSAQTADAQDGFQADFTGFGGVQGKVLGPSFHSSPYYSEWLAMRPLVQCDKDAMIFTATGQGVLHLFVDREGASPISLFQLPPSCGYSVRTSWSDLEMMVPYDACYIIQENGSYVLPLLWWGSPLKLACPVQASTPAPPVTHPVTHPATHPAPLVFCSSYGMAVQIHGQEQDLPMLEVMVNKAWTPFVSEKCAHHVHSGPGTLAFFISSSAPCVTIGVDLHLQLKFHGHKYTLSCPVIPHFPYIPDSVKPASTSPPQSPTYEQIAKLPDYLHYFYPGFPYLQLPQVYPPGSEPARPPQPTPGSPPSQQQLSVSPVGAGKLPYSPGGHPKHPSPPSQPPVVVQALYSSNLSPVQHSSPHQASKLPVGPSQYPYGLYYPYVLQAPVTIPPSPLTPPPSLPKQPMDPFYPPLSPVSYHHYGQLFYPKPGAEVQLASILHPTITPPPTTATGTTMFHKQPQSHFDLYSQFDPQKPIYFLPPTPPPPAKGEPPAPQPTCPPYSETICRYYPKPYYPHYDPLNPHHHPPHPPVPHPPMPHPSVPHPPMPHPPMPHPPMPHPSVPHPPMPHPSVPHPPVPHYPEAHQQMTTTAPTSMHPHRLQCLTGRMVVFLPFAHPDSIQVRDQTKTWQFLSNVSPLCGYSVQMVQGSGLILHSPLPACHSQPRTPTTISLPLRFWDFSTGLYRTLDLECPYKTSPETPSVSPTLPSATRVTISPAVVPKPKVLCSSHQMTVELPPGPISEVALKDINGNQMNLHNAPKHCGYSARKGKNGKILLRLQLHPQCHMSVQGKMYIITVSYMTVNGRQEAPFFCPVVIPGSGQECNLPSEQRLPCGPGSVSEAQCLSMGCCFSKHPYACYYPMDECTIDRHFVFSVPASLVEPPLAPALLVAAGNSSCKPQRVTSDYALFKIPMDGCGTRRLMVGKTLIYIVEVTNKVQAISLNYGTITRDSPVRLLVECRYLPNTVLSVSYMVKTPSLGPEVQTQGVFGVQLRIAKDGYYSSFYPQYHQPLHMLLRKPLYLEVRLLNAPDPSLVLLVHFCVAYPRSGKAVWLLLYNGCPNPLDPELQQAVLITPLSPTPQSQTRRFTISTFQFLPDGEFKDLSEEIYFMCSTEICSPRDGPCVEGCFGQ